MLVTVLLQAFVVCQSYTPPPGFTPTMLNPLLDHKVGTTDLSGSLTTFDIHNLDSSYSLRCKYTGYSY